jgi:hypothetical protein
MPATNQDLETARKLFKEGGWGSGDPYGPDDAVMHDIVGHARRAMKWEELGALRVAK